MAKIELGVRQTPVAADAEALAHCRNREDSPVLEACRRELNLRGGDKQNVTADYTVLPSDAIVFVDTSGGAVTVTLFSLLDGTDAIEAFDEKQVYVHRSGVGLLTVRDEDGALLETIADGDCHLYMANNGTWYRIGT